MRRSWWQWSALFLLAGVGCGSSGGAQGGSGGSGATGGSTGGTTGTGGTVTIGTPIEPGDPGAADVTFTIRTDMDVHAISPLIYGWNGADAIATDGQTVVRAGGNRWTAYNWENNASNAGSDYMFQNDNYLDTSTAPGHAVVSTLDPAKAYGAAALITVPILDYVSADVSPGGDVDPTHAHAAGSAYLMTRFKQNLPTKGSAFAATPDTTDGFVYQDEFVNWVKTNYGSQQVIFSLDNEPDLWSSTHAEIHPAKVSYAELVMRNTQYGAAVKAVWPTAEVAGFVSYGWTGYETLQGAPDAPGKGEFLTYYLDQMKAAEQTAGKRLVDYLDLHWYPETYVTDGYMNSTNPTRIVDQADPSPQIQAARLQAPRSLWDPTYNENNWIAQSIPGPIMLIRRLKDKIAAHYPGTKLSFSEYTFGGGHDISGGVAEADVLGIFGRDGVDMATAWNWPDAGMGNVYEIAGLQVFRNYDGKGATFGDTSIHGATSDDAASSVYASVDGGNVNRLVIVAVNKKTTSATAGIKIAHPAQFQTAAVYTLTSAGPALMAAPAITAVATNAFSYTMPAMSVSVIVPQPAM